MSKLLHTSLRRRNAIVILIVFFIAVVSLRFFARGRFDPRVEYIKSIILGRLGFLSIPSPILQQFADEFLKFDETAKSQKFHAIAIVGTAAYWNFTEDISSIFMQNFGDSIEKFKDRVATSFLLSTDYFPDQKSITKINSLYGAYNSPCYNPLSQIKSA